MAGRASTGDVSNLETPIHRLRPKTLLGWLVHLLFKVLHRFRAYGATDLDAPGPVLLIPNHVSWLDFLMLGVCLKEDWRFVTSAITAETSWLHRRIMKSRRTFPVDTSSPYAVKHIAEFLKKGGRLVLFAEGRISTTGSLMKLYEGTGFLLLKTQAKVITCYLRGANRSPWAGQSGWKRWFNPVSVHFSRLTTPPQPSHPSNAERRRQLTIWLRDLMVDQQFQVESQFGPRSVFDAIVENRYLHPGREALADMTMSTLSYRKVLAGTEILARQWNRHLPDQSRPIGVLLPNVNACPITVLSLWGIGQIPALLNYTSGMAVLLSCCRLARIETIITSRRFLERAKLDLSALEEVGIKLLYLEEIRAEIRPIDRLRILLTQILRKPFQEHPVDREATAVILFTSGSEGIPKGVELTHANLISNVQQMLSVIDVTDHDRAFNALPLFHSFGLTIGTLLPLVRGVFMILYPSPLHYRMVPALVYDQNCTIVFGTNTFLNGYARKAHRYDFQSVRYLFAGAEKTQASTFKTWAEKFGIRVLEGYGATECSPCISVNTRLEVEVGSAGRLLPGIRTRFEPVPGVEQGGRLFVSGPNIMKGYLNSEANESFLALKGWYDTGDIADIDDEGFVHILGRLKRFAKVSGEMVSLTAVEDALAGQFQHFGLRSEVAILTEPDPQRGERLIAVANHPRITLESIRDLMLTHGLPNLSIPRELRVVREIPKLGSGKTDYGTLQTTLDQRNEVPH